MRRIWKLRIGITALLISYGITKNSDTAQEIDNLFDQISMIEMGAME